MADNIKLDNIVAGFVIFAVLTGLLVTAYSNVQSMYGISKTNVNEDGEDVMDRLNNINIISGINSSLSGIYNLKNPAGSAFDILGALTSVGVGVVKIVTGILTFPIEIIGAITDFYFVPPIVSIGLGLVFIIYLAFILLGNYTGGRR